jgi:peptidoglycan/xylan/chitin deacetylase (PgdA/CDA1 family)
MFTPPPKGHGILAHYFYREPDYPKAQGALSVEEWLEGLNRYGPRLVPADEWISRCLAGRLKDECCVTFDDGLREAYMLALPALQQRGLTAAWNLYTGPYVGVPNKLEEYRWLRNHGFGSVDAFYDHVESLYGDAPADYLADRVYLTTRDRRFRYWRDQLASAEEYEAVMDDAQAMAQYQAPASRFAWIHASELRELAKAGHVIGIHTHSHPTTMECLSREQTALEYATSRAILENMLGSREPGEYGPVIDTVSHPCGSYTEYGLRWLQEHRFRLAWGATMDGEAPWATPRWSTGYWRT